MKYFCANCKQPKDESEWRFYAKRRASYCKECVLARQRAARLTPVRKAVDRAYEAKISTRLRAADRTKKWIATNPERRKATIKEVAITKVKQAAYAKERYHALKQRTPAWANQHVIKTIYEWARRLSEDGTKHVVDHVLPLRGAFVSGLHVPENLQILTYDANRHKGQYFRSDHAPTIE